MQKSMHSMNINKNIQKYKFNPNVIPKIIRPVENKTIEYNEKFRSKLFNKKNKFPLIYFYKKINIPYKYNITSVPEYLIRTDEEKRFMDKLYKSLTNEKDRNTLKDLLNKNKRKVNFRKDYYKPKYMDVQSLLKYRPNLYSKLADPLGRNTQILVATKNNTEREQDNIFNEDKNISDNPQNNNTNKIKQEKNENENIKNDSENDNIMGDENKTIKINKELSKEEQIKYKYNLSDIFNLRKEKIFLNKSAEKYLFKKTSNYSNDFIISNPNKTYSNNIYKANEENKFYTSSESKSDWIPNKRNNNKMGTNSSVSYNILCPTYAGTSRFITAKELNKNNLFNESSAFHKVKSISEFIDLTRVSATNTLGCFNRTIQIPNFKLNNSLCTNQLDAYHINRNLIEKPI